ncbi:MAG: hypothetical protein KF760_03810 [Candidatus Eremiobacteraeota bacterium]|nr:hypothetical protein [Candidatus Eremiobacteraeota bacterium]MCW5870102.1 hypothetical protein [Candidatus Eremiobacteraeota bacterium]
MHKLMKPLLCAGLLAGAASASPMWASHDDPAVLREQLRGHQSAYNTAVSNRNFDRARYERDQIEITEGKINQAEFAARWDFENSEDYHLLVKPDSDYYYRRTTITSPGVITVPGMSRVWDPLTETYYFVRVYP